ncbi:MAG: hypothetical protein A2570_01815 [Candidatus Brennerbacteria bacterium RIFOXYD1_FULL_41_16]|uniref:Uncharacterized protein n=1 Tax=Candidatus Brennerbacteria bacterium RIFOXYD1_FULL_41_16 TaxID=1797529 RepID=A0A1G1XK17_9BACT|nr:MAG: hypothetical protein A2570_01815 [Candidatus Brennerbacteria bacterium RIFOXYD1_FULL_41_16]
MKSLPKTKEEYRDLLGEFKRVYLKRILKFINFLQDKLDLTDQRSGSVTISESELQSIDLLIDDVKDMYFRLSSRKFEVFQSAERVNPIYSNFILPNPMTKRNKTIDIKKDRSIDIGLFPKEDLRNDNFYNFVFSLQNEVNNLRLLPDHTHGVKQAQEPMFDGLNKTIYYGSISHTFQGIGKGQRIEFFKLFWGDREVRRGSKIKRKGMPKPAETVAMNLNMISSSQLYKKPQYVDVREKFRNFLRSINNDFRKKKMPIVISQKGGVLISIRLNS